MNGFQQVRTGFNKFEWIWTSSNGFQQVRAVLIQGKFVDFMQNFLNNYREKIDNQGKIFQVSPSF